MAFHAVRFQQIAWSKIQEAIASMFIMQVSRSNISSLKLKQMIYFIQQPVADGLVGTIGTI